VSALFSYLFHDEKYQKNLFLIKGGIIQIDLKRMKKKKAVKLHSSQNPVFDESEDLLALMYRTYADSLYAYGLSFHSDTGLIEDAIHDVFIDIYTNERRINNISNLHQYLIAAFRHRLLFLLQRDKRYERNISGLSDLFIEKNMQESWIEDEEENNKRELVNRLLSNLTQRQREAIHLRFIEGYSYDEISEIMQIQYQSAKMLIYRAFYKIRKEEVSSSLNTDSLK
jgi:RNA polymerase sigma factor (sigma-70 family)